MHCSCLFFFQAEDGIRDTSVTGVQTCALPIFHTRQHGYAEISPPFLVRRDCMIGTTQLPKFEPDMYGLEENQLFLAPTAEVPVTNFYRGEILAIVDLPKKFVAYTHWFRREACSSRHQTRENNRANNSNK